MTLYHNGTLYPMTATPTPEAMLIHDGTIVALGTYAALSPLATEEVDLEGGILLPGFIDSHSHITALALSLDLCQLQSAQSIPHLLSLLKTYGEQPTPTPWLLAVGYDHTLLLEARHPTKQELDDLFPHRPVLLTHSSGHMAVANTAALTIFGVRSPDGYLEEGAFHGIIGHLPPAAFGDVTKNLLRSEEIYFSHGITVAQDGLITEREYDLLHSLAPQLDMDMVGYIDMASAPYLVQKPQWQQWVDGFILKGYKIFLDGSPQGRTAWLQRPYEGSDHCGDPIYSDHQVTAFVTKALTEGVQLLAHCNGDAACGQFIRCCAQAQKQTGRNLAHIRPTMIHAQLVQPAQLAQMKELGIIPSFFVSHIWHWGDVHVKNLGSRASNLSPLRAAADLGLPFTLHTDAPVIAPNLLEAITCATHRETRSGKILGQQWRITPFEALQAITVHSAYQSGLETTHGTLTPGKAADLVVLTPDLAQVQTTIKKGKVVYQR